MLSMRKMNSFISSKAGQVMSSLHWNCGLPLRNKPHCSPLLKTWSAFIVLRWEVWHLAPPRFWMTSVARSASHDCGGTGGFWKCSHAAGVLRGKKTFKTEFGTLKNERLKFSRYQVFFLHSRKRSWCLGHTWHYIRISARGSAVQMSPLVEGMFSFTTQWNISPWNNWVCFLVCSEVTHLYTSAVQKNVCKECADS